MEAVRRKQFSVLISCPNCNRAGSATWEEYERPVPVHGVQAALVGLSPGFLQLGKTVAGAPVVSCACGCCFGI